MFNLFFIEYFIRRRLLLFDANSAPPKFAISMRQGRFIGIVVLCTPVVCKTNILDYSQTRVSSLTRVEVVLVEILTEFDSLVLRKWMPRVGMALICNHSPAKVSKPINPAIDLGQLPQHSRPSMELTTDDHFTTIDTFTECGKLTPEQIFAVFHLFRNLPGYSTGKFASQVHDFYTKPVKMYVPTNKSKRFQPRS